MNVNGLEACQPLLYLISDGDSITNQNGTGGCITEGCTPAGINENRFPYKALMLMGMTGRAGLTQANVAVGGNTCTDRATQALTPTGIDAVYGRRANLAMLTFNCGINDFKQGTTNENTVYSRITGYVAARIAAGWANIIVLTVEDDTLPSPQPAWQTFRHALNTLIRNGAVANGYTVMDIAADPTMGCDGCAANPTYFRDGEHPTAAGYLIFAGYLEPLLQGFGFN